MNNFKDQKRGGFYFIEGKPMLAVTTILTAIAKPQIAYWYGQEVFYAMVKNPTLNEKEALAMPYQSSQKAASRGTTVHSIVESYKHTREHIDGIPDDFRGYAEAFYKFMDEFKPEIIEHEKTVFDTVNRVAGTLDMYCKIGDTHYILDIKTGKDIYAESELQLSAYAYALRLDKKPVDNIGVLLLETGEDKKPTGNFKFALKTENHAVFLATKQLYEWLNREKLLKVGYLI